MGLSGTGTIFLQGLQFHAVSIILVLHSVHSLITKVTLSQQLSALLNTGHFIMFSVITNIYNKKTKGPTLMELFTATGKLKKFFLTTRDVRCAHHR